MNGRVLIAVGFSLLFFGRGSLNAADPSQEALEGEIDRTKTQAGMNLSSGYDSLYMYKGGNVIPGDGIAWVRLDPVFQFGRNDILDIPFWYATALGNPLPNVVQNYREFDVPVIFTHKTGDLAFTAAHDLYFYFNYPGFRQVKGSSTNYTSDPHGPERPAPFHGFLPSIISTNSEMPMGRLMGASIRDRVFSAPP
jgi:hypothetical protein